MKKFKRNIDNIINIDKKATQNGNEIHKIIILKIIIVFPIYLIPFRGLRLRGRIIGRGELQRVKRRGDHVVQHYPLPLLFPRRV